MSSGRIHQINTSRGGVPKQPVDAERVTPAGLAGDACANPDIHGAPHQAISLFALERIESLAAEGHPIAPGSTGENVTTEGLDWEALAPGTRLRLGADAVVRITGYASPCRTIAGSFSDGRYSRLSQKKAPGWSRLYAEVLAEGEIRPGDPIAVEGVDRADSAAGDQASARSAAATAGGAMEIAYVNVYVTDLERAVDFYAKTLGLESLFADPSFGYASVAAGPIRLGLAQVDPGDAESRALVGRQTGVGFAVPDLVARHAELAEQGVAFPMPPSKQPWGGFMALFADPDGNVFYLDQIEGH